MSFAGAIVACSLGDFSGYSSGGPPSPPSTAEAGAEGGVQAGGAADARADGPLAEATDGSVPFCAAKGAGATFCEDFDGAGDLKRFGRTETVGGTLVVDDAAFTSSPRSLVATAPTSSDSASTYAVIFTDGAAHSRVQLSASVRLEALSTNGMAATQILKVWVFAQNNSYEVAMSIQGQTGKLFAFEYVSKSGYYKTLAELAPVPLSTWTRIDMDVQLANGVHVVDVDRDGVRVLDQVALSPPYTSGAIEAAIGLPYMDANHTEWRVRLDDILLKLP